jgi:hypothetical protein
LHLAARRLSSRPAICLLICHFWLHDICMVVTCRETCSSVYTSGSLRKHTHDTKTAAIWIWMKTWMHVGHLAGRGNGLGYQAHLDLTADSWSLPFISL